MGLRQKLAEAKGERLEKILPATCLGETCEFYTGEPCASYEDLLAADGKSGGVDKPPLKSDATYAVYGQVCLGADPETLVALRAETLAEGVNAMKLIAIAGRYGDLPLSVENGATAVEVRTIASSDSAS